MMIIVQQNFATQGAAFHQGVKIIAETNVSACLVLLQFSTRAELAKISAFARLSPSPAERSRRALEGLVVQGDAQDKVILVMDDVLTTGATLAAARTRLVEAGAASVILFSLTATVGDRLFEVEPRLERCPTCGGRLLTMTNRQTGERFLGCLNYRRLHCPYTRKLA